MFNLISKTKSVSKLNLHKFAIIVRILFYYNTYFTRYFTLSTNFKKLILVCKIIPKLEYTNVGHLTYKMLFKPHFTMLTYEKTFTTKLLHKHNIASLKKLFLSFIHINVFLPNTRLIPHFSYRTLYVYNSKHNVGYFNFTKTWCVWKNILNFICNLFFYNLSHMYFSSSYFRYESLTLNWHLTKNIKQFWKYSSPFLFFLNNKTTRLNDHYFYFLRNNDTRTIIVVDVYYHKRTLHYLRKYKFYTVGPVPISTDFYTLDLAFPVSSNSVFSNLFFIRLLFKFYKITSNYSFQHKLKL